MKKSQENDEEQKWDKLLQIHTTGRDDSNSDQYRYPYEPTPYTLLERFANSGLLCKENTLLDYGCGKGRVDFFSLIRHAATRSVWNITSGFMRKR